MVMEDLIWAKIENYPQKGLVFLYVMRYLEKKHPTMFTELVKFIDEWVVED